MTLEGRMQVLSVMSAAAERATLSRTACRMLYALCVVRCAFCEESHNAMNGCLLGADGPAGLAHHGGLLFHLTLPT